MVHQNRAGLKDIAKRNYNVELEVLKRNEEKEFKAQLKRWVVGRAIAWFNGYRRFCKDFECFLRSGRAMVFIFE